MADLREITDLEQAFYEIEKIKQQVNLLSDSLLSKIKDKNAVTQKSNEMIDPRTGKPFRKYTLRGFVTISLQPSGLEIRDCTLHEKAGSRWINMPSRPYEDENGNTKYSYIVFFPEKSRAQQFQEAVLKALKEYQPPEPKPQQTGSTNDDIPF